MAASRNRTSTCLVACLLFFIVNVIYIQAQEWSYNGTTGPDNWPVNYPNCGGQNQSPVNIDSKSAIHVPPMLVITNYGKDITGNFTVTNTGQSVQVNIPSDAGITIKHGLLSGVYTLAQLHFHWGSRDSQGSEHSIDNRFHDMEIHFVHYNSDLYPDIETASNKTDGLAVLGIFAKVKRNANISEMNELIKSFRQITHKDKSTTIPPFRLSFLPKYFGYFQYNGSLTTPPCYESVFWLVFKDNIEISPQQIQAFRTQLYSNVAGEPDVQLVDNFRPIQPLNRRSVRKSFKNES